MLGRVASVMLVVAVCSQAALLSETPAKKISPALVISDESALNPNEMIADPTGLLETVDAAVTLQPGFRHLKLHEDGMSDSIHDLNAFSLPITLADPNRLIFVPHFSLTGTKVDTFQTGSTSSLTTKNLSGRFGLTIVAQTHPKTFRFAADLNGMVGAVKYDGLQGTLATDIGKRMHWGVPSLGIYLGSQPGKVARFTVFVRTRLTIDTLQQLQDSAKESFSELVLPSIGFDLNIGKKDFPVASTFGWAFSRTNFTTSGNDVRNAHTVMGDNSLANHSADADAIVGDSISWRWQTIGKIPIVDILVFKPAMMMSYWHGRYSQFTPQSDNRPYGYGPEVAGTKWEYASYRLGFGIGASFRNYADIGVEYSRGFVRDVVDSSILALSKNYPASNTYSFTPDDKKPGYGRFAVAAKTDVGNYVPALAKSVDFTFGVDFMHSKENSMDLYATGIEQNFSGLIPAPELQYQGGRPTQIDRYISWYKAYLHDVTTNRFGIKLGTSFLEKQLALDFSLGFLTRKVEASQGATDPEIDVTRKGFECGIDLTYCKFKF